MSDAEGSSWDVLVGGAGIAAAAACIKLCALGFRPLVLSASQQLMPGIEAIPAVAVPLFAELHLKLALEESRSEEVEGFENHWHAAEQVVREGRWIHVERTRLATAAMQEAVRRGATAKTCRSLPKLIHEPGAVSILHDGRHLRFEAAIDATGRSAVWSRPVQCHGRQVADLYSFPAGDSPRSRVVRLQDSWAYRIGLREGTTVAIMTGDGKHRTKPDAHSRRLLGLKSSTYKYLGRRPAFPQWSENPIHGRCLAIGDAALAYDPIAGQGIRFALASALAAATVINTARNSPGERPAALRFYSDFLAQARQRHLRALDTLTRSEAHSAAHVTLPPIVVFTGNTVCAELRIGSRIVTDEAVELSDGARVRWVGGVDLLKLRDLAKTPVLTSALAQTLAKDIRPHQAGILLAWCVRNGIITSRAKALSDG